MASLPFSFLHFPSSGHIFFRVFQCISDLEPPVRALDAARRSIVQTWTPDSPILDVPLVSVDLSRRCLSLFAVGEHSQANFILGSASFDGLDETQRGSYGPIDLYPCSESCSKSPFCCEDCPQGPPSRGAIVLASLIPRATLRTAHASFLRALHDRIVHVICISSAAYQDVAYVKCPSGFLVHGQPKTGEWGLDWAPNPHEHTMDAYIVQLHTVAAGILVQIIPQRSSLAPLPSSLMPGTPLVLLPALVPVYYVRMVKSDTDIPPELLQSLEGHGHTAKEAEDYLVCWSPVHKAPEEGTSEQGVCCVWPRSMCALSTTRDIHAGIATPPTQTNPTARPPTLSAQFGLKMTSLAKPLRSSTARDFTVTAERAKNYITALVRDREQPGDTQPVSDTSKSSPSGFQQLYPSPGASPPLSVPDADLGHDFFSSSFNALDPDLWSPQPSHPLSHAEVDDFVPHASNSALAGPVNEGIIEDEMAWGDTFPIQRDDLDDLDLITDDLFDYFDSPPSVPVAIQGLTLPPLSAHPSHHPLPTTHPDLVSAFLPPIDEPLPQSFSPQIDGNSGSDESEGSSGPVEPHHTDVHSKRAYEAGFGAISLHSRPGHVVTTGSSVSTRALDLRSRYLKESDPRLAISEQLRNLKLVHSPRPFTIEERSPAPPSVDSDDDSTSAGFGEGLRTFLIPKSYNVNTPQTDPGLPNTFPADDIPFLFPTSFVLLSQPRFDLAWLPLQNSHHIGVVVSSDRRTESNMLKPIGSVYLSIPTPVSPGEQMAESEREDLLKTIIPSYAAECVDGGRLWPEQPWPDRPFIRHGFGSVWRIFRGLLLAPIDLATVVPLTAPLSQPRNKNPLKTSVETLEPPHFVLAQNGDVVHTIPAALRFWPTIGVAPLHGAKDIAAYAVYEPTDSCPAHLIHSWLDRVSRAYEDRKLGTHSVSVKQVAPLRWASLRGSVDNLVLRAGRSSKRLLMYLIVPDDLVLRCPSDFAYIAKTMRAVPEVLYQFVPIGVVNSKIWSEKSLGSFVVSIYDRCPVPIKRSLKRLEFEPDGDEVTYLQAPAFTIAQPKGPQFRFALDWETQGLDAGDRHFFLHVGYKYSHCRRWVFAAAIDQRGEAHDLRSWKVDDSNVEGSREDKVVQSLWQFMLAATRRLNAEWTVVVSKVGRLSYAEVKAWEYCIGLHSIDEDSPRHVSLMEAGPTRSFPLPSRSTIHKNDDHPQLFSEAFNTSLVFSPLRLQLPAVSSIPLGEDLAWPEGKPLDDESSVLLPLQTTFIIPRPSASVSGQPTPTPSVVMEALQVNTLFNWTAEHSALLQWRRNDVQRECLVGFNDLAGLAHARFQDSLLPWWPWHLIAVSIMARAADHLIANLRVETRDQEGAPLG